jgi:hypothetical protein
MSLEAVSDLWWKNAVIDGVHVIRLDVHGGGRHLVRVEIG